ncbi:MAG: preprotein translocase subunit YajC [Candidatus Omnitrophica bacterium]|nr:preprotein translocase subunit YajC [Candidatus Omnitrophota bacterium]
MLTAYAQNAAQGAAPQGAPSMSILGSPIFMMVIIFVIFYFLLIRPQKKQQENHKNMLQSLKKNDDVITSGGMHGTIVNVKDNSFVLRVDDNTKIEVQKSAVAILKKARQE